MIFKIILLLILLAIGVWAENRYLPIEQPFKGIIIFLTIIGCIFWCLKLANLSPF